MKERQEMCVCVCIERERKTWDGEQKKERYELDSQVRADWMILEVFVCVLWDDKDRDYYNKQWRRRQQRRQKTHIVLRWFDITILMLILHTREKPIKTRHPLNSRIYYFLFALLCFTSHCDLCSGFWLSLFSSFPNHHHHPAHFNRQSSEPIFVYYRYIDRNATISNIRMCDKHSLCQVCNKSEWVRERGGSC